MSDFNSTKPPWPYKEVAKAKDKEIERLQAEHRIQNECIADQHDTIRRLREALECYARVDWWPEQLRSHDYLRRLAEEALKGFESE